MKAVPSHACVWAAGTQELVAPRGAVSADYVDFALGVIQRHSQVVEQVEEVRIEVVYVTRTMIAKKMVKLVQSFR
jgi:hypothetical protein